MAHVDLLPDGEDLRRQFVEEAGLTPEQATEVVRKVGYYLRLHADYYRDRYEMHGERQDTGAADALGDLASGLDR